MTRQKRTVPDGYVKTSFEITRKVKYLLEDLRTSLRRQDGYEGISEAAIIEALIIAADLDPPYEVLDEVVSRRKKAQRNARKHRP